MSVREYIGARYVPLFADPIAWDSTKTYEPLTIVYYQGNSYTSRQAVPAGIDIANETYWALTGNYNAQIEQYRTEVQTFDERIEDLESALPISEFDSTDTVDARFDSIEQNIEDIQQRSFLCLGDSYGSGTYRNSSDTGYGNSEFGWLNYMKNVVASRTGCKVYTNLETIITGNSGFTSTQKFIDVIDDLVDRSVIPDVNEITDIVVFAGTNDNDSSASAIRTAVQTFMAKCYATFPNVKRIKIGYISVLFNSNVIEGYRNGCELYGGEYVNSIKNLFAIRQYISPDGVHPNEDGYGFYCRYLIDAVFNGNISYQHKYVIEGTLRNSGFTLHNLYMYVTITPDNIYLSIIQSSAAGDAIKIVPNTRPSVGTIPTQTFIIDVPNMPIFSYYSLLLTSVKIRKIEDFKNYNNENVNTVSEFSNGGAFVLGGTPTELKVWVGAFIVDSSTSNINYIITNNNTIMIG